MRNTVSKRKSRMAILCCVIGRYARKRARMRVCVIFYKMLKMAWNVCKQNLRRFWAFTIFARALTRGRTRTCAFFDLKLTGRILTLIMINMNEKWISVMKIWTWVNIHKMAPRWRHQSRSRLKTSVCFCLYAYTYVCQMSRHLIELFSSYLVNKKSSYENIRWSVLYTAHLIKINRDVTHL